MTQHVTDEVTGSDRHGNRTLLWKETLNSKTIKPLSETYCLVPPAAPPTEKPPPCKTTRNAIPESARLESDEAQISWFTTVGQLLQKEQLNKCDNISCHGQLTLLIFSIQFAVHLQSQACCQCFVIVHTLWQW